MTRYLVDVYRIDIPENGKHKDDITENTEDWLVKLGRFKCYDRQLQGNSLKEIIDRLNSISQSEGV